MDILQDLALPLQPLFGTEADRLARESGFILRQRVFSGSSFLQTCVLTWTRHPDATLEQLVATASSLGLSVAPQSIDERLGLRAAEFFRLVLGRCLKAAIAPLPRSLPLLCRFDGVFLDDATHIALPAALAHLFPGCGGSTEASGAAVLKLLFRWEVSSARVAGLVDGSPRTGDTTMSEQLPPLPPGSLRLADVAFFKLQTLAEMDRAGVFWISKLKHGTALRVAGQPVKSLAEWLEGRGKDRVDRWVMLGGRGKEAVRCRLVAWRLSPEQAAKRREKALKDGRDKGYVPGAETLALCSWIVLVSNVPREKLSWREVSEVYRTRWQIELLFKAFKSDLKVDEWRTEKPGRILAEIYGKLVAALAQSWVALLGWAEGPAKSVRRVLKSLKDLVAKALERLAEDGVEAMVACLEKARPGMRRLGGLPKRKKGKGTFQALEELPIPYEPVDIDEGLLDTAEFSLS